MKSVYAELAAKIALDPSLIRRSGPRQDLGLLLFSARDGIDELWKAAAECALAMGDSPESSRLRDAVARLSPIFGEREDKR